MATTTRCSARALLATAAAAIGAVLFLAGGARSPSSDLRFSLSSLRGGSRTSHVHHDGGQRLLELSAFRDPRSTAPRPPALDAPPPPNDEPHFRIAGYRKEGWPGHEGYLLIEVLSPRPGHIYSVTINSPGKYTGTATLLSKQPPSLADIEAGNASPPSSLAYAWQPALPLDDYRIEVHELGPGYCCAQSAKTKTKSIAGSPLMFAVSPKKLGGEPGVANMLQRWNEAPPCQTLTNVDAFSTWEGTWIGPELRHRTDHLPGNALRSGWSFLPSTQMGGGCRLETFSREELLSIPPKPNGNETHIYVVGTSFMRGVYHGLLDLLLPQGDKRSFFASVLYKCWGRSDIKKGNLRLTYQDLRITEMEPPDQVGADLIECHNNQVVKEGMSFLRDSYKFWEELFHNPAQWPDVIFFGSGYRWADNHDFETHTLWFAKSLPPAWKGTIIFSGGQFHGGLGLEGLEAYNRYQTEIRQMIATMDDPRVRWLDGIGVSKEHRLYTEAGPKHISGSAHFHSGRGCQLPVHEPNGEIEYKMARKDMKICSNVTDAVGQLLLGHALGPKEQFLERVKEANSYGVGERAELEMCTACNTFKPFRIIPYPQLTCRRGPIPKMGSDGSEIPTKDCPDYCLSQKPDYSFPSQSDTVFVRKCVAQHFSSS